MKYIFFIFLSIIFTSSAKDKLQQYKNEFYKTNAKPKIKIQAISRKVMPKPEEGTSDGLDFSFMEENKPVRSKRKRKLKSFTLDTIVNKKQDDKKLVEKKQEIDPLELQSHMILSQGKMHKNTSAIELLTQLSLQHKSSAIPLKALAIYYLQKKQTAKAIPYLKRASFHSKPSQQAAAILRKYYLKNNKSVELKRLNQYLQTKLEKVDQ